MSKPEIQHNREELKLNPTPFFVLILYPFLIISLTIWYVSNYGFQTFELVFLLVSYYGANISVGLGLHRLWAHGAYKVNRGVEFILALVSAGTLQGPAIAWASDHTRHHSFTDTENDPHSPLTYDSGFKGFLWAHLGWMLFEKRGWKKIERAVIVKLGRNKILLWQMKYYWYIAAFMNLVLPLCLGYLIGSGLLGAIGGFIFMGLGRFLQQQMTFCVNSLCHFVGSRKYYNGTAGDIWWMFIFLLGENWHNYHHAFAKDYRNGFKWYQLDIHKWLIYMLYKFGLAYDLVITSKERIQAKMLDTAKYRQDDLIKNLEHYRKLSLDIAFEAKNYLLRLEKTATEVKSGIRIKIEKLDQTASLYADYLKEVIDKKDFHSYKIYRVALNQYQKIERLSRNILTIN